MVIPAVLIVRNLFIRYPVPGKSKPYLKIFLPGNQVLGGLFGFLRKIGRNLVPQAVSSGTLRSLKSGVSDLDSLNPDLAKNLNVDPEDP